MNVIDIFFKLFELLASYANIMYNWLFTPVNLGIKIDIIGIDWSINFTPFFAIGGGVIITLLVARLIKLFIPVT